MLFYIREWVQHAVLYIIMRECVLHEVLYIRD